MTRAAFTLALASASMLAGCIRSPNPLFPGLRGSIGLPHEGTLRGAVPLGDSAFPLARLRTDDRRWANPALARILLRAAHRTGLRDSPLVIADVASVDGAEISGHRSHRTGRDADVLFYFRDMSGAPVRTTDFLAVGPDGLAWDPAERRWLTFDDARNWQLVKALLDNSEVAIHWIFVHRQLRARLLRHASAVGEASWLLYEASERLAQPMPSGPHDDHFHVRIACPPGTVAEGCENGWTGRGRSMPLTGMSFAASEIREAIVHILREL